jgi:hypothetical protein
MFEHYLAALLSLRRGWGDLAYSALPDAPVQPVPEDPTAEPAVVAGPTGSSEWDPCPCRRWGVVRADLHGCVALVRELFPEVERELDAWDAAYGRLYR